MAATTSRTAGSERVLWCPALSPCPWVAPRKRGQGQGCSEGPSVHRALGRLRRLCSSAPGPRGTPGTDAMGDRAQGHPPPPWDVPRPSLTTLVLSHDGGHTPHDSHDPGSLCVLQLRQGPGRVGSGRCSERAVGLWGQSGSRGGWRRKRSDRLQYLARGAGAARPTGTVCGTHADPVLAHCAGGGQDGLKPGCEETPRSLPGRPRPRPRTRPAETSTPTPALRGRQWLDAARLHVENGSSTRGSFRRLLETTTWGPSLSPSQRHRGAGGRLLTGPPGPRGGAAGQGSKGPPNPPEGPLCALLKASSLEFSPLGTVCLGRWPLSPSLRPWNLPGALRAQATPPLFLPRPPATQGKSTHRQQSVFYGNCYLPLRTANYTGEVNILRKPPQNGSPWVGPRPVSPTYNSVGCSISPGRPPAALLSRSNAAAFPAARLYPTVATEDTGGKWEEVPSVGRQDVQAQGSAPTCPGGRGGGCGAGAPQAPAVLPGGTQASLQDGRQTQAGGVQSGPGRRLRARELTSVLRKVRKPPWFVRNRGAVGSTLEPGPGGRPWRAACPHPTAPVLARGSRCSKDGGTGASGMLGPAQEVWKGAPHSGFTCGSGRADTSPSW